MRIKLLLDANISPETAIFLRMHGFNVKSLIEEKLGYIMDAEVAALAIKEHRIIITFDLDFGELYYFSTKKRFSAIILRLNDQRVETANITLKQFFENHHALFNTKEKILAIVSDYDIRVIR